MSVRPGVAPSGPTDVERGLDMLTEAIVMSHRTPAVMSTRPWWWSLGNRVAGLRMHPGHLDRRAALLECGLALGHAGSALAAGGSAAAVRRFADGSEGDLVATLREAEAMPADWPTYRALYGRQPTGPSHDGDRFDRAEIAALSAVTERHGARLEVVGATRRLEFEHLVLPDPTHRDEGGASRAYVVLTMDSDALYDWLVGGEALSALWRACAAGDLVAELLPSVATSARVRTQLRSLLDATRHPIMAVRIGRARPLPPRRPAT